MIVASDGSPLLVTGSQFHKVFLKTHIGCASELSTGEGVFIYQLPSVFRPGWPLGVLMLLFPPSFVNEWESHSQVSQFTALEKARGWWQAADDTAETVAVSYTHAELTATEIAGVNCRLRGVWYVHLVSIESNSTKGLQGHYSNR